MKSLQEIKDEVARENGYDHWDQLMCDCSLSGYRVESHMNEVAKETQRRCSRSVINDSSLELYGSEWNEIEELILTERNIPEFI